MALWGTFNWSDGTLWADAHGDTAFTSAEIDRSGYQVSLKVSYTNSTYPGSLASLIIQTASLEVGVRPQLDSGYVAYIDRNENSNRISVVFRHTANPDVNLLTEGSDEILAEDSSEVLIDVPQPIVLENIHILASQRSRVQPTG